MASSSRSERSPSLLRRSDKMSMKTKENCHPVDLQKLLAERENRRKREEDLAKLKDSELNQELSQGSVTLNLGESALENFQEDPVEKLDATLVVVKIFDPQFVFHIFKKEDVRFSWLQPDCGIEEIPWDANSDTILSHLETRIQVLCLRRSMSTACCRFLLFLMSVHDNLDIAETCCDILVSQADNSLMPYSPQIPDILAILINYGTVQGCLWPIERELIYPTPFAGRQFDSFASQPQSEFQFPVENLKLVLKVLCTYMKSNPCYSEEEKEGLFFLLLNVAMATEVSCDYDCILIIQDILCTILMTYTEEEWSEMSYKKVEDLALRCWHKELEPIGIVQRIELIPRSTLRGIQLQKAAAYFAIQNLLDFNPISLYGIVSFDEILQLFEHKQFVDYPTDLNIIYSVVMLLSYSVDVDDSNEVDRDKLKKFKRYITEWRHTISDSTPDLDGRPMLVKDLMAQLVVVWCDLVPVDTVV